MLWMCASDYVHNVFSLSSEYILAAIILTRKSSNGSHKPLQTWVIHLFLFSSCVERKDSLLAVLCATRFYYSFCSDFAVHCFPSIVLVLNMSFSSPQTARTQVTFFSYWIQVADPCFFIFLSANLCILFSIKSLIDKS